MAVSIYQVSVPLFLRHLQALAGCLRKAQALYSEKKYDESTLLSYRLYPDMYNFTKQVQAATRHALTCTTMLAGLDTPKFSDDERSLAELITRVENAVAFLKTLTPSQIEGSEDQSYTIKNTRKFTGLELVTNRFLPHFYFHTTTAYDIMRHNGVPLVKSNFMRAA